MSDTIYVGNDARLKMQVRDKVTGVPLDFVALSVDRAQFYMAGVLVDSNDLPAAFDYTTEGADGKIEIDLTGIQFPAGSFGARLVIFYPAKPSGVVVADGYPVNVGEAITGSVPVFTNYTSIVAGDNITLTPAGNILTIAASTYTRTFEGAVATFSDGTITGAVEIVVPFDTQVIDTNNFFSPGSPGVFTIPAGVTVVNIKIIIGDFVFDASGVEAGQHDISFVVYDDAHNIVYANNFPGLFPDGGVAQDSLYNSTCHAETGPIEVTEGQIFHAVALLGVTDDVVTMNFGRFTLEVLG